MGKNSSRRFYRNYNELGATNNILLPPDVDMPGIAPLVQTDGATAGVRSRGTYGKDGLLYYPEIDTPNNLRRSYTADGRSNGWILESSLQNFIYGANNFATSGNAINWVTSGITKVPVTGPDGRTNSAVSLTATTSNASISLSRGAIGAGTRRFSVWLKAVSVTGPVYIQVVNAASVTVAVSTSEWRRFEVSAASGQVNCGIRLSNIGDMVLAYAPDLVLSTFACSTSLPENQLNASSDFLTAYFPIPGSSPTSGATVFLKVESNVRETGMNNNSTGVFVPGTTASGSVVLGGLAGDVYSQATFTLGFGGGSNVAVADNVNTSLEDNQGVFGTLYSFSCALSIAPGRLIASSSINDLVSIQDPGIVIYDPLYEAGDPPFVSVNVSSGAFYIKTLAAWPFAMDGNGLNSLLSNFR